MSDSILTSTKKVLGLDESYTVFDVDITMHINSVFMILQQLGIGPEEGFMIDDKTVLWDEFLGDDLRLNAVKSYMYLRVRSMFDPPTTSYLIAAVDKQIAEFEWRLNVHRETTAWVDPDPDLVEDDEDLILDGGSP